MLGKSGIYAGFVVRLASILNQQNTYPSIDEYITAFGKLHVPKITWILDKDTLTGTPRIRPRILDSTTQADYLAIKDAASGCAFK